LVQTQPGVGTEPTGHWYGTNRALVQTQQVIGTEPTGRRSVSNEPFTSAASGSRSQSSVCRLLSGLPHRRQALPGKQTADVSRIAPRISGQLRITPLVLPHRLCKQEGLNYISIVTQVGIRGKLGKGASQMLRAHHAAPLHRSAVKSIPTVGILCIPSRLACFLHSLPL
jgi:hypothetical protein